MSPSKDPVDAALESLRVHGASPCDSLSHDLEQKLMDADRRSSTRTSWLVKSLIAAAVLTSGGVVGYAAVESGWWQGITFYADDDGVVTNDQGEVVGGTVENEDGTYSTLIELGEGDGFPVVDGVGIVGSGMSITIDEPLNGKSISIGAVEGTDGNFILIETAPPEKLAPGDEE
jgi:hypothetical protein